MSPRIQGRISIRPRLAGVLWGAGEKVPFRGLVMAKIEWEVMAKVGYVI